MKEQKSDLQKNTMRQQQNEHVHFKNRLKTKGTNTEVYICVLHMTYGPFDRKYIWIIGTKNFKNYKTSFRSIFGFTGKLGGGDIKSAAVYFSTIPGN